MAQAGAWCHVNWGTSAFQPVMGPFTGSGAIQLRDAGVRLYGSQGAAEAAPAQNITKTQGDLILRVAMSGPGIGHQGFFGLGYDSNPKNIVNQVGNLTGVNAIGDFFTRLERPELWVRVGEVVAGFLLLYVGAKTFFPTQINAVTSSVKGAAKKGAAGALFL